MKEEKKEEIIESAIKLSAKHGFYNTSVQGIADDCGISKGAFYHYFDSKEKLHIAIFQYYFEQMHEMLGKIDNSGLSPREIMRQQLRVPFDQLSKQREFFIIYLREQNFSINKELQGVMHQSQLDMVKWYKQNLERIYGNAIQPFISDIILLIEGMRNSYMATILFHDLRLDADRIAHFFNEPHGRCSTSIP
ncbi:TetR/AcrR family transcriptional regulator [Virgibacillus halophilus]|uniref:TetR/AcrR family transcriptional regulator n=1 Tax=Tigheibacillus halophilus TaxID=361280 RepID=A0ABU5C6I8_9BACI|nr:TetR/AcrR family transcriptional regulator [Virgibacillus halophilus]